MAANISSMYIGLILIGIAALGIGTYYTNLYHNYGIQSEDIENQYDITNSIAEDMKNMTTKIENPEGGLSVLGTASLIWNGAWTVITIPFKIIGYISSIADSVIKSFGSFIPSWFTKALIEGIISVVVILTIVSAIFKYKI